MSNSLKKLEAENGSEAEQQKHRHREIPVSLGKPSLRLRMEAYYSLVAPDIIADQEAWRSKFDLIYEKFGGSHEKERRLAAKLAKKYGATTVKLLLAESVETKQSTAPRIDTAEKQSEEWYCLKQNEENSGVIDMLSRNFDPVAALGASDKQVAKANPWLLQTGPMLDYVDQFRIHLPSCDPLRRLPSRRQRQRSNEESSQNDGKRPKNLSAFASLAAPHEIGPLSLLYTAFVNRQRIRIVIRYVNGIRGTLTGYLIAFDKHFNMILRDVDEVYSPRNVSSESTLSNVDREVHRRQDGGSGKSSGHAGEWSARRRRMKQIMVRGDNVVTVYKEESERSVWPRTSKSPAKSMYQTVTTKIPTENRVGTPGSLGFAIEQERWQRQGNKRQRHENWSGGQQERQWRR